MTMDEFVHWQEFAKLKQEYEEEALEEALEEAKRRNGN
jgi:hypothetical protein